MQKSIPKILAILVFTSGLVNITSSFWANSISRMKVINELIPLEITHASRTLTLLSGFFLIYLARGLWHQKKRAWILSIFILLLSFFLHLIKGLDLEESIVVTILIIVLFIYRKAFWVKGDRASLIYSVKRTLLILLTLLGYAVFGLFALQGQFNNQVTPVNIYKDYQYSIFGIGTDTLVPQTRRALWFDESLSVVGTVTLLLAFGSLFAPLIDRKKPTSEEFKIARSLVLGYADNSSDYLVLMGDKQYFFNRAKNCFVTYKIENGFAVVLGGPIGPKSETYKCLREFLSFLHSRGLGKVIVNLYYNQARAYKALGLKTLKIGQEAIIKIDDFDIQASSLKDVRNSVNKINREGVIFKWYRLSDIPWKVTTQLDSLHREWLNSRKGPKMTFSGDFYPLPVEDNAFLVASFNKSDNLIGAFTFFPYKYSERPAFSLELMLRSQNSPNSLAEATIAESVRFFKESKITFLSLGLAPLSNLSGINRGLIGKASKPIFDLLNKFYGFKSLYNFKKKFNPVWVDKFIAYKGNTDLPGATLAIVQAHIEAGGLFQTIAKRIQLRRFSNKKVLLALPLLFFVFFYKVAINNWDTWLIKISYIYYNYRNSAKQTQEAGTLEKEFINSNSLGVSREIKIYLPNEYYDSTKRYPVLYMLHGFPGSVDDWVINGDIVNKLDAMIKGKQLTPLVVVFPDGNGTKFHDGQYVNATKIDQPMENYILEVINFIDSHYRTINKRESRAIGGLSAGGYGAANIGFRHNDLIGNILCLSGYFENNEGITNKLLDGSAKADNNPIDYINNLQIDSKTNVFMSIGESDNKNFISENKKIDKILSEKGIPHLLLITKGWHDWEVWRRDIVKALEYLNTVIKSN